MDKKLQSMLNEQIKNELYSSYLYLSMAAYCESVNLSGFAHWLKIQATEETGHGMKIYEFLIDRGVRVMLKEIPQPPSEFKSALAIFEETLHHEQKVTGMINSLYELALETSDHASSVFLQWFITEQVEEEKNATQILEMLKVIKPESSALLMLDRQLSKRATEK